MLGFGFNKDKVRAAADKFVQQGKLQNAIAEYDKILKQDPKDLTILNTVGDLYSRLGQNDQAVQCFKKVGDSYAAEGFVPKAIAMYKKLTKLSPNSFDAVQKLGELYTQQGLYNDARAQFLQAADGLMKGGQSDDAIKIMKRILEVDPENAGVQAKLADMYLKQGKRDDAKTILLGAAESMYQRNAVDAAAEILNRLLTIDKDNPRARMLQGQVLLEKGDANGAIQALEFLPDIDSRPDALRTMMRALVTTGRLSEAEPVARKMFNVHHDIGGIAAITEKTVATDPVKGLKYYEEFGDKLIATSQNSVVSSLRGIVSKVKDNVNSLEILLKLFQRAGDSSQNAEISQMIAEACVRSGQETDLRRAAQLYKHLAQLEPENTLHMQSYKQVLTKLGEDPTAAEAAVAADANTPFVGGMDDWSAPPQFTSAEEATEKSFDEMSPEEQAAARAKAAAAAPADAPAEAAAAPAEFQMDAAAPAAAPSAFDVAPAAPSEAPAFDMGTPAAQPSFDVAPAEQPAVSEFTMPEAPAAPAEMPIAAAPVEEVHDLSDEWEKHVAEPETPLVDRSQVNEINLPDTVSGAPFQAAMQPVGELIEETKFYIAQKMWKEATAAIEKLSDISPGHEQLMPLRESLASAQASQPAADGAVVQEISLEAPMVDAGEVIEVAAPEATVQEISFEPPPPPPPAPPKAAPAKAAAPPPPKAPPKPAAAAADDILGDLVSDLDASLGDDFALGKPAPHAAPPASAAAAAAKAPEPPKAAPAPPPPPPKAAPAPASDAGLLDDLFDEIKEDLGESKEETVEDPDTHYNLGVAFKEMGLLDEAIGELQKVCQAIDHGAKFSQMVQAYTWLANCFVEKGVPEASFMWFEKALVIAPDSDSKAAILYELGSAYEGANQLDKARETFTKVMAINIDFRDVAERIKALKS